MPVLMSKWEAIQFSPPMLPIWHEPIQHREKSFTVRRFEDMDHFMKDNEFETFTWLFGEVGVEPYCSCL